MVAVLAFIQIFGGIFQGFYDFVEAFGVDSRVVDFFAVLGVVAAVDSAAGQVDEDVSVFEVELGPVTAYGCYLVAAGAEVAGEDGANLSGAADDDFHLVLVWRGFGLGKFICMVSGAEAPHGLKPAVTWECGSRRVNSVFGGGVFSRDSVRRC